MQNQGHHRLKVEADVGALRLHVEVTFNSPWTVIFGPSGSGKSSLLRMMGGVLKTKEIAFWRMSAEQVWSDLFRLKPEARRLGYAPQGGLLFPHLTIKDNVEYARSSESFAPQVVDAFAIQTLWGKLPRQLSGGEQQRVNLARAFAKPDVLLMLLDEPFTGIGREQRDTLLPLMRERMAAVGVPVISVTHDVEEALMLGAEVVRLEEGKVVARGPAAEVLAAEREKMMGVLGQVSKVK